MKLFIAILIPSLLTAQTGSSQSTFKTTGGTVLTSVSAVLNSAFLYDIGYSAFASACSNASALSKTLVVSSVWSIPSGTYNCDILFMTSGKVRANSSAAIGFTGKITAPDAQWVIDVTTNSGASISSFASPPTYIQANWFGPVGDDSTDNASRLAAAYSVSKLTHTKTVLAPGIYRYTAPLLLDGQGSGFCGPMLAGGNGTNAAVLKRINDAIGVKVLALAVEFCDLAVTGVSAGTAVGVQIGDAPHDATGLNMHGIFVSSLGGNCFDLQRVNSSIIDIEGLSCGGDGLHIVSASGVDVNGNDFRRVLMTGMTGNGIYLDLASTNHFGTVVVQGNATGVTLKYADNVFDFIYEEGNSVASIVFSGGSAFSNKVTGRFLSFPPSGSVTSNYVTDLHLGYSGFGLQFLIQTPGPVFAPTSFLSLPTPGTGTGQAPEGTMRILYNGTPGSPCTVGAKVVIAIQMGGVWNCSSAFN